MTKNTISFLLFSAFLLLSCTIAPLGKAHKYTLRANKSLHKAPRKSFVQIENRLDFTRCTLGVGCKRGKTKADGSGFIVKQSKKGTVIMTASHVCKVTPPPHLNVKILKSDLYVKDLKKKNYKVKIIAMNRKNDMCLLLSKKRINYPSVKLAKKAPVEKDRIVNIAAPGGIVYKDVIPIFEGVYIGSKSGKQLYTLYAIGGSSGSMILNSDGELVGIVTHAHPKIPIVIGPKHSDLKNFLTKHLKKY